MYRGRAGSAESRGGSTTSSPARTGSTLTRRTPRDFAERTYLALLDQDPSSRCRNSTATPTRLGSKTRPALRPAVRPPARPPGPRRDGPRSAGQFRMGMPTLRPARPPRSCRWSIRARGRGPPFDLDANEVTEADSTPSFATTRPYPVDPDACGGQGLGPDPGVAGPRRGTMPGDGRHASAMAAEFAAFRGCRLPREDELEFAAGRSARGQPRPPAGGRCGPSAPTPAIARARGMPFSTSRATPARSPC